MLCWPFMIINFLALGSIHDLSFSLRSLLFHHNRMKMIAILITTINSLKCDLNELSMKVLKESYFLLNV